mmetsp:Transcript_42009/g.101036  ORF Transcript_42009/g.101036 Transcript_42009/m.101036 type:complete len:230 (+) Transcript_42009:63-752(+)
MSYELTYFALPALAESSRLAFTLGGIAFKDNVVDGEAWGKLKGGPEHPLTSGGLPWLCVDGGKKYGQSAAVARYVGKIAKYEGKALYPEDPLAALEVDGIMDAVKDMFDSVSKTFAIQDAAEKIAARKKLLEEGQPVHTWLTRFSKMAEQSSSGYLVGDSPTLADLSLFASLNLMRCGFLDGIDMTLLEPFPALKAHKEKIASLPPIQAYYEGYAGPGAEMRAAFKVGA